MDIVAVHPICQFRAPRRAYPESGAMTEQTLAAAVDDPQERQRGFSRYQALLIALLAFTQFTIILDFIIMSPLGAILMPALDITAGQFGVAVSAYAFSAGISGILAAGFADRFVASACCCSSMSASRSGPCSAPPRRTTMCCCSAGS
nr:hypothetical protein [Bradyrhizobium sp. 164]